MSERKPVAGWNEATFCGFFTLDVGSIGLYVAQRGTPLWHALTGPAGHHFDPLPVGPFDSADEAKIACEDYARAELAKMAGILSMEFRS